VAVIKATFVIEQEDKQDATLTLTGKSCNEDTDAVSMQERSGCGGSDKMMKAL
jgi:hypothetical protein